MYLTLCLKPPSQKFFSSQTTVFISFNSGNKLGWQFSLRIKNKMNSMSCRIVYLCIKNKMSSMSSRGPYILSKTGDSSDDFSEIKG